MDFVKQINPGAKAFVIFNGFSGHLNLGAGYRDVIQSLAERCDIGYTLLVPGQWAYDQIAGVIGDVKVLGWDVVENDLTSSWPSQLLVLDAGCYSGLCFDHNSYPGPFQADAAKDLWNHYAKEIDL